MKNKNKLKLKSITYKKEIDLNTYFKPIFNKFYNEEMKKVYTE